MRYKAKLYQWIYKLFIGVSFVGAFSTFIIFDKKLSNVNYYFTGAITLIGGLLAYFFYKNYKRIRDIIFLKENWPEGLNTKKNLKSIKNYFVKCKEHKGDTCFLDDQTWTDLNMDDIFLKIDVSITTPGEQVLYDILRNPLLEEEELRNRDNIIEHFQNNSTDRENLQINLLDLGKQSEGDILELFNMGKVNTKFKIICEILGIAPLVILPFYFIYGSAILLPFIAIFTMNTYIHYRLSKNIINQVNSIAYLGNLIAISKNIVKEDHNVLKCYLDELSKNIKDIGNIDKHSVSINRIEGLDLLGDYVNVLLLSRLRSYYKIVDKIYDYNENIKNIYRVIGELDSLLSVAAYRERTKTYSKPQFLYNEKGLELMEAVHPLIDIPTANSIKLKNSGIILTGSNMSGKSTFLRTVAINTILAQSIYTTLTKEYKGSFFKILTSLSPEDNVKKGKSYYLGEAEALLRILNSFEEKVPTLTMIDEIFRGTNPIERISASAEILQYISNENVIALVATHDLELTEMANDKFHCYYFSEDVDETEGLKFDYTIKPGVSPTRNAIKLLKYIGYPNEIIEGANNRINRLYRHQ
ncbi:MutS family DNA mismatch repair protein [Clostridium sp.]|uniref:MutS-related protein n=1 Tax=Clostridium sp. TaxID=1506 RepID=UPI002FC84E46